MSNDYNAENIYNINLYLVLEELRLIKEEMEFCTCAICLGDISVIVLSKLPPHYVTNVLDKESEIRSVDRSAIRALLKMAIKRVTKNPHH